MGSDMCQVKYLMLRCYRLVGKQPLNYKRQLFDTKRDICWIQSQIPCPPLIPLLKYALEDDVSLDVNAFYEV
jgi:hypothetical protein